MWNCGSNRDEAGSEGIKAVRTEALGAAQEPGQQAGSWARPVFFWAANQARSRGRDSSGMTEL